MIYLSGFRFPDAAQEANYMANSWRAKQSCYDSYYPFGLFEGRTLPELIMLVLFLVLAFIVPVVALRLLNNRSVVERLRVNE